MHISYRVLLIFILLIIVGCGKSELEMEKERLRREADALRRKIDTTQSKIDSARKEMDSLTYRVKKDSAIVDSLVKKLTPFKK